VHIDVENHLFVHASRKDAHVEKTDPYRVRYEEAQMAEYWRKLYVAMTRAEDELYATGTLTKQGKVEGTWYEAIADALTPEAEITDGAIIFPRERPPVEPVDGSDAIVEAARPLDLDPLPKHQIREVVRPSTASKPADIERVYETAAEAAYDAETARKRGIALHALLQHLPKVPEADWTAVALRALAAIAADIPDQHESLAQKAISIIGKHPTVFGPGSRAEIPFLAPGKRKATEILLAGRIDRLIATDETILIVDFKSDANPPATRDGVPVTYLTQLALYAMVANQLFPGRAMKAAILWTSLESLMELTPEQLTKVAQGFTLG
jgi:ATP-dependent helicase/nuclease subunit A